MKPSIPILIAIITFCMSLLYCTADYAGGTTETVNTKVAGVILKPDGTPASNAQVRLIPTGQFPLSKNAVFHYSKTDNQGHYQFAIDSKGKEEFYNLLATTEKLAVFQDSIALKPNSSLEMENSVLKSQGSIRGMVSLPSTSNLDTVYVSVMGTDIFGAFTTGKFTLEGVPSSSLVFRISSADQHIHYHDTLIHIPQDTTVELEDTVKLPFKSFLLDNFDDGNQLLLHNDMTFEYGFNSFWYTFDEKADSNNSHIDPNINTTEGLAQLFSTSDALEGRSMHISFTLAQRQVPFAGIGCNIGPRGGYVDLTNLTAISFYLKGRGTIGVSFDSKHVESYPEADRWGRWGKTIECPDMWTRIEIPASDLLPQSYSPQERDSLLWNMVCDSVKTLHFTTSAFAGDTVELQLDSIALEGISEDDLY